MEARQDCSRAVYGSYDTVDMGGEARAVGVAFFKPASGCFATP